MFWIILILNISYIYVAKIVFLIRVLSQTGVTDADRCAGLWSMIVKSSSTFCYAAPPIDIQEVSVCTWAVESLPSFVFVTVVITSSVLQQTGVGDGERLYNQQHADVWHILIVYVTTKQIW